MPWIELVRPLYGSTTRIACLAGLAIALAAQAASGAPVANFSRTIVQFGFVPRTVTSQVQPVFLTNTGDSPLDVTGLALSGAQSAAFAVAGTCAPALSLAPGARCRIDLTLTPPTSVGFGAPVTATLTVASSAGAVDIVLRGAVDPGFEYLAFVADPASVDIPAQAVGTASATQTILITNKTDQTFAITQIGLVGGNVGDFTLTADCAAGQFMPPGRICTASVTFVPQANGPRSTELSFQPTLHGTTGTTRVSITGTGGAGPAPFNLDQHGLTGSWFEPATSGQGIEIEVFKDLVAAGTGLLQGSWFTFDHVASGGADHGRWYTFGGNVSAASGSATLPIYQNVGGNFNAAPVTAGTQVGSAVLSFTDCATAQMAYTFTDGSNRSGTVALTRLTSNVTCTPSGAGPTNPDFGYSGNWYDAAKAGQGFVFEVNPAAQVVFFAWYTYAVNGQGAGAAGQRWYTGQASYVVGARTIALTLYETTGGLFDAPAPAPHSASVGTATIAFVSCASARLTFAFTGGSNAGQSGAIDLTRVGPIPAGCGP